MQQGITVTLPKATNSVDKPETRGQTTIAISVDKHVYLNAKEVAEAERQSRARPSRTILEDKKADEKVVFIKADQGVDYGAVMATMDQLRAAGHRGHGPHH